LSSRGPNPSEEQITRVHDAIASARGSITLTRLVEDLGIVERLVRECVAHLVRAGIPIVSLGEGLGFELTRDPAKIRHEIEFLRSYRDKFDARIRGLESNLPPQESLFR